MLEYLRKWFLKYDIISFLRKMRGDLFLLLFIISFYKF